MPSVLRSSALMLALGSVAIASQDEAETCVRELVSNAYPQGWAVRTITRVDLGAGETCTYLVTLYAGVDYRITSCGDPSTLEVDLVLYDAAGQPIAQDLGRGRSGELSYRPPATDTFFVAVRVAERKPAPTAQPGVSRSSVATAVLYK